MQVKASSRLDEQPSETTTKKLGGNRILAMKICNFLLTKCFHGRAVLARPSRRADPTPRSWAGGAQGSGRSRNGAGGSRQSLVTLPVPFFSYLYGLLHETH